MEQTAKNMMCNAICVFLCFTAVLLGLAGCKHSDPYSRIPDCEITAPLDSILNLYLTADAPGALMMIVRDYSVMYSRCYGIASYDTVRIITPSTMFNVAESSKSFSVAGIMKLVEDGYLDLDKPVREYFTEMPTAAFDTITLRQVLTQSTGLPNVIPQNKKEWDALRRAVPIHFARRRDYINFGREEDLTLAYALLDSLASGLHAPVCADFDLPFMLVKQIVENVAGEPFDVWMGNNVIAPAGVGNIAYRDPDREISGLAHAYAPYTAEKDRAGRFITTDGKWIEDDYGDSPAFLTKADNGVYTTGREFLLWIAALEAGKVVSEESVGKIYTPQVESDTPGVWYGLGNMITTTDSGAKKVYHLSRNGGFYSLDVSFPDKNVSYIVFSNRPEWNLPELMEKTDSVLMAKKWI